MLTRNDPVAVRWLVGLELMRLREVAGTSLVKTAAAAGMSKTTLSHKESGKVGQSPQDIEKLLSVLGAQSELQRMLDLCAMSDERTWWAQWTDIVPKWLRIMLGLEGIAQEAFLYEPMIVPGILQTREYAEAITRASDFVRPDHIEPIVELRMARAERLHQEVRLKLHAVIERSVLERRVGDDEVMRGQYDYLLRLAEQPNVTIQVVLPERGPHAAVNAGSFEVFHFRNASPTAYVELFDNALYVRETQGNRTYRLFAKEVAAHALSPKDSVREIEVFKTALQ